MSENMLDDNEANYPESPRRAEPDAHGQAALLLTESLLHTLLGANVLTLNQAIGAVRTAAEVKMDVALEEGETTAVMQDSLQLLAMIGTSLGTDSATDPDVP